MSTCKPDEIEINTISSVLNDKMTVLWHKYQSQTVPAAGAKKPVTQPPRPGECTYEEIGQAWSKSCNQYKPQKPA